MEPPKIESTNRERIIAFDILRIIAAFAVVWLHVSAQRWTSTFPSLEWEIRNVYDAFVRWSVPVFVMISGALFLDSSKTISLKRLYRKNVVRIVVAFLFWSVIYVVYSHLKKGQWDSIPFFIRLIIQGPVHFWFLKMLIGLYIIIPLLRTIVAKRRDEVYFLCLSLITVFILPVIWKIVGYFNYDLAFFLRKTMESLGLNVALGYSGYFVLGHFLYNHQFGRRTRMMIYASGMISFVFVAFITHFLSHHVNRAEIYFYDNLTLFTLLEAAAVFVWITSSCHQVSASVRRFIILLSECSFGIYLVHYLLLDIISSRIPVPSAWWLLLFIPVFSILVFALSYLVIRVLRSVPFMKRFVL